jgi:hypothetical protein
LRTGSVIGSIRDASIVGRPLINKKKRGTPFVPGRHRCPGAAST